MWRTNMMLLLVWMGAAALPARAATTLGEALFDGRPILDVRLRYEHVEEDALLRTADANTLRTRLGYETRPYYGVHALLEMENVIHLGAEEFNDTVNRKTRFPVVADPDDTELNQGYLNFEGLPDSNLRFGRQRIVLDNQRFVGAVGFRQNEQTFDAFAAENRSLRDTAFQYIYVFNVNRIFGDDSPVGDFDSDSHLLHLDYDGLRHGRATAYGYLLDLEAAGLSSQTYGVRFAGSRRFRFNRDLGLVYAAEFAHQRDYADNRADYALNYYLLEPGVIIGDLVAKVGYEVLGGDGVSAFQTPLATLHAFNGLTDQFLVTPPDGLEDLYAKVMYEWRDLRSIEALHIGAAYHSFSSEDEDEHLGSEWSVEAAAVIRRFRFSVEYAEFDSSGFKTDKEITWVTVQFRY